jgi:hypothetical protein
MTRLYEVLYVSTLAPATVVTEIAEIVARARAKNERLGITGLLVFDGVRFCQQLEGAHKQVLKLMETIREDPRHAGVEVVHHGPLAQPRFRRFALGFVQAGQEDALQAIEQADGEAALLRFLALVPMLDLDP